MFCVRAPDECRAPGLAWELDWTPLAQAPSPDTPHPHTMSFLTRRALGRLGLIQPTRATLNSHFCHNVLTRRFNSTETSAETPAETPAETVPQSLRETGLRDEVPELILDEGRGSNIDWSRSFHGLSIQPFPQEIVDILQVPVNMDEVEMRPGTPQLLSV